TCLVPLFPFSFARTLCWVVERKEGEGLRSASRGTEAAFGGFAGGRGAADRVGVSLREEDGSGRKARPSIRALETSTDQELNQQIPLFNLPPKILCRVVNINLKVSSIFSSTSVRFTGTITGIGDISSQWQGSKWRSLKVQWDEASSILRPEKISPWDVEPFGGSISTSSDAQAGFIKNKRARSPLGLPGHGNESEVSPLLCFPFISM
ncbi:hypothetical protein BHM03_00052165, partial [Ensete ventricosum]